MPEPIFVEHRGQRILRLDFSDVPPREMRSAVDKARQVISAEPNRSLRMLTVMYGRLTPDGVARVRTAAMANKPHLRASAMVGSRYWKGIYADIRARGRGELTLFDDEATALDWLAAQ
ncbi:MAG TPA: hypothetical protein VF400_07410 [Anaeromyxobacteraceae bacterium]